MNIYQAALQLRQDYAHTDIQSQAIDDQEGNLYLIVHDALHTYLNARPQESDEALVLATELVLGGQEYTHLPYLATITPDQISTALASINTENLEYLIEYYTYYHTH